MPGPQRTCQSPLLASRTAVFALLVSTRIHLLPQIAPANEWMSRIWSVEPNVYMICGENLDPALALDSLCSQGRMPTTAPVTSRSLAVAGCSSPPGARVQPGLNANKHAEASHGG